jgi:hypothetical protein
VFLSSLRDNILAGDARSLHLGHHGGHVALQPTQALDGISESGLNAILPLERLDIQLDFGRLSGNLLLARFQHVVVALETVAQLLGLVRSSGGGHGALEGCDVLEELFFLCDEVCDATALARVEWLVDSFWLGGGFGEESIWDDG